MNYHRPAKGVKIERTKRAIYATVRIPATDEGRKIAQLLIGKRVARLHHGDPGEPLQFDETEYLNDSDWLISEDGDVETAGQVRERARAVQKQTRGWFRGQKKASVDKG